METFKYGDKVTHQLHGAGKVHNSYPDENLVQVFFEGQRGQTLVHPVSLTKVVVGPRVVRDSTVTTVTRTIEIEGGPRLHAGPAYRAGIDVVIDTVTIVNNGDAVASGYRFRDGQLNQSYIHSLRYYRSTYPDWLKAIL